MTFAKILATFSVFRPEIPSRHITAVGMIPLVLENFPKGAKLPQKVTNLFVKTAVFTPGILGSMITLCMSTKKYAFEGVDSISASSLYNFLETFALSS